MQLFSKKLIEENDFAFLYGFSIFETFLVDKNSKIFLLEKHIERLLKSIIFFKIDFKFSLEDISSLILNYINDHKLCNCILRVTISTGSRTDGIRSQIHFLKRENTYSEEKINFGYKLQISNIRKSETSILLGHKTSNYLENFYILQNAINNGFDDSILLNNLNNITETTKSNLFFVKNKKLYTPDINGGLLPGILRSWIIDTALKNNVFYEEGFFTIDNLLSSEEVFITNSAFGIMHVRMIEEKIINNGNEGPMTKFFKDKFIDNNKVT